MAKAKRQEQQTLPVQASEGQTNPLMLLDQAVKSGTSVEVLERLMGLAERYEKTMARKAYDRAMADLRPDLPKIVKDQPVAYGQGRASYKYEDLSDLTEALSPVMSNHGLSFRWRTACKDNGNVLVTCIIAHQDGHSEECSLEGPPDLSGNKNPAQGIGSITSYLQRYTLKAAVGVAAAKDDDAQSVGTPGKPPEQPRPPQQGFDKTKPPQQPPRGPEGPRTYPIVKAHIDLDNEIKAYVKKNPDHGAPDDEAAYKYILKQLTSWDGYYHKTDPCKACNGTGKGKGPKGLCEQCGGNKTRWVYPSKGFDEIDQISEKMAGAALGTMRERIKEHNGK